MYTNVFVLLFIFIHSFMRPKPPISLFSFLYRLDVDENKIQAAMFKGGDLSSSLAILIVDRQIQRFQTKREYKDDIYNWEWE